ncbi:MAG: ABC transporter permease [Candidatus Aenigmarchaeota archaeon]|nr:ABC transporter permease [Candidatus Aenigmarchaeota archaeon]
MFKFFYILAKNLLRTYRSRRFLIISLVSPVILVLFVGFIFTSQSLSNVKIGVIGDNKFLADADEITIIQYPNDDDCIDAIKYGNVHACVNMSESGTDVNIFTDFSKIALADAIINRVKEEIIKTSDIAEMDVLRSIVSSAEKMKNSIKASLVKLTSLKSDLVKSNDELALLAKKQESFNEFKSKIGGNQNDLNDFTSSTQEVEKKIIVSISKLNENKKLIENEMIKCSEAKLAVALQFVLVDCIEREADIDEYRFLLAVSCSNYTALLRNMPVVMCDSLNIANTLVDEKITILNEENDEINSTLESLQSMQSTLQKSKGSINDLQITLDSVRTIDIGEGKDLSDKLSTAVTQLEVMETGLEGNFEFTPINLANGTLQITAKPVMVTKTEEQFFYLVVFILLITFSTVLVSSSLMIKERDSPGFIRNVISPTRGSVLFFGIFINNIIIAFIQASVFFMFLVIKGTYIPINLLDAIGVLFLIVVALVLIGMLLALLFEKRETSILGTITALVTLLILSGLLIPIEKMSGYAYLLGKFSPLAIMMELSRKVILFNLSLNNAMTEVIYLSVFSVVMFFMVLTINKIKMRF